jgi:hypothetical protein
VTRDESLQIVRMVLSGWPQAKELDQEEIDLYARSIQDMDAELTTHAVLKAVKDSQYRPTVAELRERVRAERKLLAPQVDPIEPSVGKPLQMWVRRWICARMLYERFGKERDLRGFPEQASFRDLTLEKMPEGAWVEEAESLGELSFHEAFAHMFRT